MPIGMSPKTQGMMQPPPTPDDEARAFEDGFTQMAQSVLAGKFPELMESVVTFQVLDSNVDDGSAVGAFVLAVNGETLFIPVVLASNQIKPLEIIYYKDKNTFLPLDREWLSEIERGSLDDLGEGVKPPDALEPDQSIRDVVIPPTVGRNVYASAEKGELLTAFLTEAPNHVKLAFRKVLETRRPVLKYAFENFDGDKLMDALRPHVVKTASVAPAEAVVLTPNDNAIAFRKYFGKNAGAAFQYATKVGYVVLDNREKPNVAIETEEPVWRTTPNENGFYKIHMCDGTQKMALVIANPQDFESPVYAGKRTDMTLGRDEYWATHRETDGNVLSPPVPKRQTTYQFLVYFDNGTMVTTTKPPVGEWVPAESVDGKFAKLVNGDDFPVGTGYGAFICWEGGKLEGTKPIDIASISTGSDGVRRMKTSYGRMLVTDPNSPISNLVAPRGGNLTYIPKNYQFLKGTMGNVEDLLLGASDNLAYCRELQKVGAYEHKVAQAGAGLFSIDGEASLDKVAALRELIVIGGLGQDDAEGLIKKAENRGSCPFYLVNPEQLSAFAKVAQGGPPMAAGPPPGMDPSMGGGMPPGAEGMPPEMGGGMPPEMMGGMPPEMMGGMPPEMMAPPEPPPPNPVELAVDDIGAQVMEQSAQVAEQLASEQRELSNKMNILQSVKDRAMQIASEMSGMPPEGAPAGPEQMPPPMAPEGAAEMGAPPSDPSMGGMPPGADPSMGGMPPGAAGAPMPPGMDPAAGGMPPGGVEEAQSAEMMAAQGGPMMEEAAMLEDPEAFEATAIGAMATDSDLREAVASYIPNLEKAVDNLGRILLTLWMKEGELRAEIGEQDFTDLEKRLQTVFANLGALVLKINQTAMAAQEGSSDLQES